MVATAVPGVEAIVVDGETGFVVDVDDFDAMVEAVASLLADPVRRRAMGSARGRGASSASASTPWHRVGATRSVPLLAAP